MSVQGSQFDRLGCDNTIQSAQSRLGVKEWFQLYEVGCGRLWLGEIEQPTDRGCDSIGLWLNWSSTGVQLEFDRSSTRV
ncbi:MAG: hypothetical protein EA001_13410 [Oscillatoriales cyanobacterium]|nr:MAG: hypothetical protein EA001_13410 [Oscillatoriales cyanobacterium]